MVFLTTGYCVFWGFSELYRKFRTVVVSRVRDGAFVGALASSDVSFGNITFPKRVRVSKIAVLPLGESDWREPDPKVVRSTLLGNAQKIRVQQINGDQMCTSSTMACVA